MWLRGSNDEYRVSYQRALGFYKKIENLMPGELRDSLEEKDLSQKQKEELIARILLMQKENNKLDSLIEEQKSMARG